MNGRRYVSTEDVVNILEDAVERLEDAPHNEFADDVAKIKAALPAIKNLPDPYWVPTGEVIITR